MKILGIQIGGGNSNPTPQPQGMTFEQAKADFLSKNPSVADALAKLNADLAPSGLPAEYNDVPYHTYVNGIAVWTIGGYKAATQDDTHGF